MRVTAPLVPDVRVACARVLLPLNQHLERYCPTATRAGPEDVPPVLQRVHGMPEAGKLTVRVV
jgi:hypothetical protein